MGLSRPAGLGLAVVAGLSLGATPTDPAMAWCWGIAGVGLGIMAGWVFRRIRHMYGQPPDAPRQMHGEAEQQGSIAPLVSTFEQRIGHRFSNRELLEQVLRPQEKAPPPTPLSLLGESVFRVAMLDQAFTQHPDRSVHLGRLAAFAEDASTTTPRRLVPAKVLHSHQQFTPGVRQMSNTAVRHVAMELFGALAIEGDLQAVRRLVEPFSRRMLRQVTVEEHAGHDHAQLFGRALMELVVARELYDHFPYPREAETYRWMFRVLTSSDMVRRLCRGEGAGADALAARLASTSATHGGLDGKGLDRVRDLVLALFEQYARQPAAGRVVHVFVENSLMIRGANAIEQAFDAYYHRYEEILYRAQGRFERHEWDRARHDDRERMELYPAAIDRIELTMRHMLGDRVTDHAFWDKLRVEFSERVVRRYKADLAQTFFYSMMRRVFLSVGEPVEYQDDGIAERYRGPQVTPYRTYRKTHNRTTQDLLVEVFQSLEFAAPFEDASDAVTRATKLIDARVGETFGRLPDDAIHVLQSVCYRNDKVYVVGRIHVGGGIVPLVLVLGHPKGRGITLEDVLLREEPVDELFGYTHAPFRVVPGAYREMMDFLKTLMPRKDSAALYASIGFIHPGKLAAIEEIRRHLSQSGERFVHPEGEKGWVMSVFALPSSPYVFKVISPVTHKETVDNPDQVKAAYHLVHLANRAGRMVDAMVFQNLRLDAATFSKEVLAELRDRAKDMIVEKDGAIILKHVYLQERGIPLDVYVARLDAHAQERRRVLDDHQRAIHELEAVGLRLGIDTGLKNFMVNRHGRVVLYDYDELSLATFPESDVEVAQAGRAQAAAHAGLVASIPVRAPRQVQEAEPVSQARRADLSWSEEASRDLHQRLAQALDLQPMLPVTERLWYGPLEDPGAGQAFGVVLVRFGPLFFIDEAAYQRLDVSFKTELAGNVIRVNQLYRSRLGKAGLVEYMGMAMELLDGLTPSDRRVIDVDTPDGLLALVAWKRGVDRVDVTGIRPEQLAQARANVGLNGLEEGKDFRIIEAGPTDPEAFARAVSEAQPGEAVLIGDLTARRREDNADLIALLHRLPNVTAVLGNAYTVDYLKRSDALGNDQEQLVAQGFTRHNSRMRTEDPEEIHSDSMASWLMVKTPAPPAESGAVVLYLNPLPAVWPILVGLTRWRSGHLLNVVLMSSMALAFYAVGLIPGPKAVWWESLIKSTLDFVTFTALGDTLSKRRNQEPISRHSLWGAARAGLINGPFTWLFYLLIAPIPGAVGNVLRTLLVAFVLVPIRNVILGMLFASRVKQPVAVVEGRSRLRLFKDALLSGLLVWPPTNLDSATANRVFEGHWLMRFVSFVKNWVVQALLPEWMRAPAEAPLNALFGLMYAWANHEPRPSIVAREHWVRAIRRAAAQPWLNATVSSALLGALALLALHARAATPLLYGVPLVAFLSLSWHRGVALAWYAIPAFGLLVARRLYIKEGNLTATVEVEGAVLTNGIVGSES